MRTWKEAKSLFRLLKDIWKASPGRIFMELLSVCSQVLNSMVVRIVLVKLILDRVVAGEFVLAGWLVGFAAVADLILSAFDSYMGDCYRPMQAIKLRRYFQGKLYRNVVSADIRYYDDPEYYNRYIRAAENSDSAAQAFLATTQAFLVTAAEILFSGTLIVSGLGGLIWLVVIPSTIYAISTAKNAKVRAKMNEAVNTPKKKMNYVRRIFFAKENALDLRMTGIKKLLIQFLDQSQEEALNAMAPHAAVRTKLYALQGFLFYYQYAGFMILLAWRALVVGDLSVGDYSMLFGAALTLSNNWRFFGNTIGKFLEHALFCDCYYSFLEQLEKRAGVGGNKQPESFLELEFSGTSFHYPQREENVFSNLSIRLKKHQRIAVVGPNGVGKSTFINLILGFYAPQEGRITYNSTELSEYDQGAYRRIYAMMFQDSRLYPFSIAQNLLLCKEVEPKEQEQIWDVLRQVGMEEAVKALPFGLNTPLTKEFDSEGAVFSQGQQQRLLFARALLRKAQVFLMDEPTAAQDARMESEMNALFRRLSENKTLLLISHRLSTISGMEYIYLLNDQGIEEEGTHKELMELDGRYAGIYRRQAELYQMD
ncbi:MAG: ABC transporter ATP-binding protein/permease [Lachnospiraceae bacterium]|nr:ABC transporter ATP-binding protein/permease [Lachnospiraceae bacterium]